MHPYRVKNYLWLVIIALFMIISLLSGCSSAPKTQMSQFCHTSKLTIDSDIVNCNTSKTVKSTDGTTSSTTELYCSDDPVERMMEKRAGLAYNCGEFVQPIRLGGRIVYERAISCQRLDGSWYVLPVIR